MCLSVYSARMTRGAGVYRVLNFYFWGGRENEPSGYAQLKKRRWWVYPTEETQALVYAMACVQSFKAFLKSRETGLIQKSAEWAKARQETVGASEISVLTGSSPFETKETLISKKICPADMGKNVACTWGFLFEPIIRRYFEEKNSVKVFGHTISLNLAKDHPLYGKVTCRRLLFMQG